MTYLTSKGTILKLQKKDDLFDFQHETKTGDTLACGTNTSIDELNDLMYEQGVKFAHCADARLYFFKANTKEE